MRIEQIVELQLRGPGPPGLTRTSITGYLMTKQKPLRKIFEWVFIYCWNVARDNAPYFPLPGPNYV